MRTDQRDELIGVPRPVAARVIGVSEDRLRSWDRVGLVVPRVTRETGSRRFVAYSLEDLVQGCVVRELEQRDVHIRVIRRVVEAARCKTIPEPLSQLRWATDDRHVYVGYDGDTWVDGHAPGQVVIVETINLEEIRAEARRKAVSRPDDAVGTFERRRQVQASQPVFSGTRTPVDALVPYIERGYSDERILRAFPHLSPVDIEAAREHFAPAS